MRTVKCIMKENKINLAIWIAFLPVLLCLGHSFFGTFFLKQFFLLGFITIGVSIEMICGDFDISFAAQMACSTVLAAYFVSHTGNIWLAFLIVILINALAGVTKGMLMVVFRMPTIIMTLALQIIFSNFFAGLTGGNSIRFPLDKYYYQNTIFQTMIAVIFVLMALGAFLLLERSYYGKYCRILGENMVLAEERGVKTGPILIIIHVVASLFFSIAAFIMLVQTGSGSSSLGSTYLFRALGAVCLGGVGIVNGKGKVSGMICGTISMLLIIFGMTVSGYLNRMESIMEGGIILLTILNSRRYSP